MRWAIVASSFFCSGERDGNWWVMLKKEKGKMDNYYKQQNVSLTELVFFTPLSVWKYLAYMLNFGPDSEKDSFCSSH